MHDKTSTSFLYVCYLMMEDECKINNPEFAYKWFSKDEIEASNELIDSDKVLIEEFYIKKSKNYLKLDCYQDEKGDYIWK